MKTKKISKKYKLSRRIIHFLIIIIVIVIWQVKVIANNEYYIDNIRKLWQEEKYEQVLPILLNYRDNQPNGKDLEVDYMIATSACRSPREWSFGRNVLRWIKYNYTLSQENLNIVDEELNNCNETNTTSIRLNFREQYQITTANVRGKEFLNLNDFPLNSKPLGLKEEIPLKEFNSRLFKPEQRKEAIISVKNRLGSNYKRAYCGYRGIG